MPWSHGRSYIWDVTIPDSLVSKAGAVAARAESLNESKYRQLALSYLFSPLAIESLGVIGPKSWNFLSDPGRGIKRYSVEVKSFSYLIQRNLV